MDIRIGQPLAAARSALERRTVAGSPMRTADWDLVEAQIREASFFSSTVEDVRYLEEMKARLMERINVIATGGRSTMDKAKFVDEMRVLAEMAGLRPEDAQSGRGSLVDPGSRRRLSLIWDIQIGLAEGRARWLAETDPAILPFAPAWEFTRIGNRQEWRDWPRRWVEAGMPVPVGSGGPYGPRMIALKTEPGWARLSRFGLPWAPFDFGSGMGLKTIRRREARELGLLPSLAPANAATPPVAPPLPEPATVVELPRLTETGEGLAKAQLGDLVSVNRIGKIISWNGPVIARAAEAMAAGRIGDVMPGGMNVGRSGERFAKVLQAAFTLLGAAGAAALSGVQKVGPETPLVMAPDAGARNLTPEELRLFFLLWREAEPETDSSGAAWLKLEIGDGRVIAARVRSGPAGLEVLAIEARQKRDDQTGREVAA